LEGADNVAYLAPGVVWKSVRRGNPSG